jgi:hypothetical protein
VDGTARWRDKRGFEALADSWTWIFAVVVAVFGVVFGSLVVSEGVLVAVVFAFGALLLELAVVLSIRQGRSRRPS